MSSFKSIFVSLFFTLMAGAAQAHEGHDDADQPISQLQVATLADRALTVLQKNKEIDASWKAQHRAETQVLPTNGTQVYVVKYQNPAVSDNGKRTLYIFIDALGNYVDSNYTGKLTGK